MRLDLPPPRRYEDFEDLCLDLWRELLHDPDAQKHGRAGQPQSAVDIFGRSNGEREWVGIACKVSQRPLRASDLLDDIERARSFTPPLSKFIVATTGPRDVKIQQVAREITAVQQDDGAFTIAIYSWDDIQDLLHAHPEIARKHYERLGPSAATEPEPRPTFSAAAWRLETITLNNVGPTDQLQLDLSQRLNLLTGDNGLGKTFVLDVIWWLLTGTWADQSALPGRQGSVPTIGCSVLPPSGEAETLVSSFDYQKLGWTPLHRQEPSAGLVVYLQAEGSISIWDPARFGFALEDQQAGQIEVRKASTHLSRKQLWEGLTAGEVVVCNGLIRDWVSWQHQDHPLFGTLSRAVAKLFPHESETVRAAAPSRISPRDARQIPTLELPYGRIPVTHISAGMRRILGLAYALVWAWNEHQELSRLRNAAPVSQMVLLIDELEAHLHPQWQRALLPALSEVISLLGDEIVVQTVASTHAPLVLASVEPDFDPDFDSVFTLALDGGRVEARRIPWAPQGDAVGWLTSDAFGLRQARSREAERAIEAAGAYMRGDLQNLPQGLSSQEEIHDRLCRVVPGHDPFWPRWIISLKKAV